MKRNEIYKVIDGERDYQDKKWGGILHDEEHSVADWLTYIRVYMRRAEEAITTSQGNEEALENLRKIVAMGIACFEVYGVPERVINLPENYV